MGTTASSFPSCCSILVGRLQVEGNYINPESAFTNSFEKKFCQFSIVQMGGVLPKDVVAIDDRKSMNQSL